MHKSEYWANINTDIKKHSCVDLSFCWLIFNTGIFSLSQNMLFIVRLESLSLTIKSMFCEREKVPVLNIKKHIKNCTTCLEFQQMQPKEKIVHHDIPLRPWKVLGTDVFHFINKNYLCIVDYHSKFPVIKRLKGLSTENLIATAKVIFAEYGIPCKLMSDAGTNFVSDRFRKFYSSLNIEPSNIIIQLTGLRYHACLR